MRALRRFPLRLRDGLQICSPGLRPGRLGRMSTGLLGGIRAVHPSLYWLKPSTQGARAFSSGGEESVQELVQRVGAAKKWANEEIQEELDALVKARMKTAADLRALSSEDWPRLGLSLGMERALKDAVKQTPTNVRRSPPALFARPIFEHTEDDDVCTIGGQPRLQQNLSLVREAVHKLLRFRTDSNQKKTVVTVGGIARSGKTRLATAALPVAIAEKAQEVAQNMQVEKHKQGGACGFLVVDCLTAYSETTLLGKLKFLLQACGGKVPTDRNGKEVDAYGQDHAAERAVFAALQALLRSQPAFFVATIDEFHALYAGLTAQDTDWLGAYLRNLFLDEYIPAVFVLSASTHPMLTLALYHSPVHGTTLRSGVQLNTPVLDVDLKVFRKQAAEHFGVSEEHVVSVEQEMLRKRGLVNAAMVDQVLSLDPESVAKLMKRVYAIYRRDLLALSTGAEELEHDLVNLLLRLSVDGFVPSDWLDIDDWKGFLRHRDAGGYEVVDPLFNMAVLAGVNSAGNGWDRLSLQNSKPGSVELGLLVLRAHIRDNCVPGRAPDPEAEQILADAVVGEKGYLIEALEPNIRAHHRKPESLLRKLPHVEEWLFKAFLNGLHHGVPQDRTNILALGLAVYGGRKALHTLLDRLSSVYLR